MGSRGEGRPHDQTAVSGAPLPLAPSPLGGAHDEMAPSVIRAYKSSHVEWRLKQRQRSDVRAERPTAGLRPEAEAAATC
jgi:hypothetical protein